MKRNEINAPLGILQILCLAGRHVINLIHHQQPKI